MSFRSSYYGGFPGPPANHYNHVRFQDQRRGLNPPTPVYTQTFQDVAYYGDPNAHSFFPPNQNQSFNSSIYHTDYGFTFQSQFYPIQQPAEYYFDSNYNSNYSPALNSGTPHVPLESRSNLSNSKQSSKTFPVLSSLDQSTSHKSLGNESSSSGKSRRFSHQRNVKDNASAGSSGEMFTSLGYGEEEKESKRMGHSIRFSHQREVKQFSQGKSSSPILESSQSFSNEDVHPEGNKAESRKSKGVINIKGSASKKNNSKSIPVDSRNQATVLLDQLTYGTYECMVCCDRVRPQHAVWSCSTCYNLFHMGCIKKWARSPAAKSEESGWRCPGCQNVTKTVPNTYYCFCGKVRDPELRRGETPHSCGEICGRSRKENPDCIHPCNILCHPGPCPQCPAMVNKRCKCGKVSSRIRCNQQKNFSCDKPCGKLRNCGLHKCEVVCHSGSCDECQIEIEQACYCGESKRVVICGSNEHSSSLHDKNGFYSCGRICGKQLLCGNHFCQDVCHMEPCKSCPFLPSSVIVCPCTQTKLTEIKNEDGTTAERKSCIDPIPTCNKVCGKPLRCGGDEVHMCKLKCHTSDCPPCEDGLTAAVCRCGKTEKKIKCKDFVKLDQFVCQKRCNKKRKCGKHKCGKTCCVDKEHNCPQICGRKLSCGLHHCEEMCHRGPCHTCYNVSFDELYCHCGGEVMYPPIPCGTKPPECTRECARIHSCTHPVRHTCHSQAECPPCTELVKKPCNCGKTLRSNIMCHIVNVSCGEACGKTLPCGHKCLKPCHRGPCISEGEKCKQPCSIMRTECIHPCARPCHSGNPCPQSPCKAMVTLKCPCGRREEQVECSEGGAIIQSVNSAISASKDTIDIHQLLRPGATNLRTLSCDEECAVIARNKRLAEAFNIERDDYSSTSAYKYSEFLITAAKNDPPFVRSVEKELMNLVEKVQWMGIAKHSYSFPSMKREKRQVVHELAEAFKCKSESRDFEPKRNVVVIAEKGQSQHPTPLLGDVMREKVMTTQKTVLPKFPRKGLLSSMKLVSYSSAEKSRADDVKSKQTSQMQMQRKASPFTSSTSAYKPPSRSGDPLASLSYPQTKAQRVSGGEFVRTFNGMSLSSEKKDLSKATTVSTSPKVKEEEPPTDIDYFDMTD